MIKQITFRGVEKLYDTELSEVIGVKENEPFALIAREGRKGSS